MAKTMTIRQQKFVASYLAGQSGIQAAIDAGYSPKSAKYAARQLLNVCKNTREAIAAEQNKLAEKAAYNGERALEELDEAIQFSIKTKNATAYARCIELKAKLCGLLNESGRDSAAQEFHIHVIDVNRVCHEPDRN